MRICTLTPLRLKGSDPFGVGETVFGVRLGEAADDCFAEGVFSRVVDLVVVELVHDVCESEFAFGVSKSQ